MDQSLLSKLFAKLGVAILALAIADLLFLNWVVIKQTPTKDQEPEERVVDVDTSSADIEASPTPTAPASTKTQITETKTIVEKDTQTIVQTAQKEIFVPIGSGSTKSRSWVDLSGLEVTIDTSKYSTIDSVVFEGSLWVQDANGKAYAQLYNKTDGSTVWNSEISTLSGSSTLKTSPNISLSSGNKTYVVQAKTDLVEYAAHVDGARIKIVLK